MFNGPVITRYQEVPVTHLPGEADGLRVAHISDLHFRRFDLTAMQAQAHLLELDYDLLVCTGDIGDRPERTERTAELCRRFFEPLAARTRCLVVTGNHDSSELAGVLDIPVTFLLNDWISVRVGSGRIVVAGLDQAGGQYGDIDRALSGIPPGSTVVLLAHYPSTIYRVTDERVRAVLSGHTHGGQIRLPFIGCVWAQDEIPVRMARGLHIVHGRSLHVTAGIGVATPIRLRFLCPPEIVVLTLRRASGTADAERPPCEAALVEVRE